MVKFCCFIFLLTSALCFFGMSKNQFEISDLDYNSNQIIVDFAKKMQKKGLHACGISGREESGKIMDFKVSFQYGQILDIPSARKLVVEIVLLFVEEINNNEAVRKYLYHYPFTLNNVIVSILPDCSILNEIDCTRFVIVKSYLGKILYCRDDGVTRPFVDLHKETFDDAEKILGNDR